MATATDERTAVLETRGNSFAEGLEGEEGTDISYAYISDLDLNQYSMGSLGGEAANRGGENKETEAYQVQTARLYRIAETFIRQMRETL